MIARQTLLDRFHGMMAKGVPIIGGGAGTGLSAKCEEAGGIDLIVIYNSGRYRMAGRGSLAGLLAYGDANQIVVEMAREVLPEVAPADGAAGDREAWHDSARIIEALDEPELASALAILTARLPPESPRHIAARLRLSTRDLKTACWLHEAVAFVDGLSASDLDQCPWSQLQPWLAHDAAFLLADLLRARAACGHGSAATAGWVTAKLQLPREQLDPPPLVTGNDLLGAGVPAGRAVGQTLAALRALQLDGRITTRDAAVEWVRTQQSE